MNTFDHVYLSPHPDDAVLSCGGRIWQQAQAGARVLVVTVFADAPPPGAPLSPFARELHARWGSPAGAAAARREEDRAALRLLGATASHWPYVDCVYRRAPDGGFLYAGEETLWGEIRPEDDGLVAELAARLAGLPLERDGRLYAPAGAGHHVDHRIVRRALPDALRAATLYEDYPYAEDPREVAKALGEKRWRPETVWLTEEALAAKTAAVACYRSQISTFWPDAGRMAAAVRAFAERVGRGKPAERYWLRR